MIKITDKSKCCGCNACQLACNHHAICMVEDEDGFLYPLVDTERCTDCGLCERVCPFIPDNKEHTRYNTFDSVQFFAGQLRQKEDLSEVSSGGACWAFVQTILRDGGVVYGAKQESLDVVVHYRAQTIEEARLLRRSKYLQSNLGKTFLNIKEDLMCGHKVLFCGTGCQVAALNTFLRKPYDLLYTCDVVCHGVPSIKVWKKYREEKEHTVGKRMVDLVFRDKTKGWLHNQYKITYDNGSVEYENSTRQLFHSGYLQGLFYRPSCGTCPFASIPRVGDISLADYWQYRGRFHSSENDVGVSLIAVNTHKGLELLQNAEDFMEVEATSAELALASCRHMDEHPVENPQREAFFALFHKRGYHVAAKRFINIPSAPTVLMRIKNKVKKLLKWK